MQVWYNSELDIIYIPQDEKWDRVYLLGVGYIWHYIGEL